jgi:transcriptional regulator with GAF, ATPase, and Fis domain
MSLEGVLDYEPRNQHLCLASDAASSMNDVFFAEDEIPVRPGFAGIVGQSRALREVLDLVEMVAASDSTVLLLGETGTGKELIARHSRSEPPQAPSLR